MAKTVISPAMDVLSSQSSQTCDFGLLVDPRPAFMRIDHRQLPSQSSGPCLLTLSSEILCARDGSFTLSEAPHTDRGDDVSNMLEGCGILLKECIGKGAFSQVYRAEGPEGELAVKVFSPQKGKAGRDIVVEEQAAFLQLRHPHIIQLLQVLPGPPSCMLLEYCQGGDLFHLLHVPDDQITVSLRHQISFARDVADAMAYVHNKGMIHRDVKSANCLLAELMVPMAAEAPAVKLADLGLSRIVGEAMTASVGTQRWMAPEVFEGGIYDDRADVYSYGVLLYEILSRSVPYGNDKTADPRFPLRVLSGLRPDLALISQEAPQTLKDLITSCWHGDREQRPQMDGVLGVLQDAVNELC